MGIDGLSEIVFIFDTSDKLAAVLMTLPKGEGFGDLHSGNFTKTAKALAAKYKQVEKSQPFVGDARATFRQGDSVVELDAPHLSFTMALRYMTQALQKPSNSNRPATKPPRNARRPTSSDHRCSITAKTKEQSMQTLNQEELQHMVDVIVREVNPETVILFGSHARTRGCAARL